MTSPNVPERKVVAGRGGDVAPSPARIVAPADWETCGLYVTTWDAHIGVVSISLDGEVKARLAGPMAQDFWEHVRSLKSQGAKSCFIDGALFALRANEPGA